jgi:hypothetical protein
LCKQGPPGPANAVAIGGAGCYPNVTSIAALGASRGSPARDGPCEVVHGGAGVGLLSLTGGDVRLGKEGSMSRLSVTALVFAVGAMLAVQGCETHTGSLRQQWRAACTKSDSFGFSGNVAECVAKHQAAYEAESLSGVAQ